MNFTQFTVFILAAMLAACATPTNNMRFYSLANASSSKSLTEKVSSNTPGIAIEVLPVNVPERLKRPQLVITSKNSSQLKILEQDRWASSFNDELQDAFVSGLSQQLNAIDISRGGRIANQPTYRIAIVLQQFNATPGDQVQATFGWTITRLNADARSSEVRALSCQANISKAVAGDIDAVVTGAKEIITEAIQDIAANVNSLNNGETAKCTS
ncbi:MAG: hypothetical protein CTY33_05375 [Methylotenera sp.]|nr:MAG: hypothetical protein CTY33_05375 [Methylotenera sp.]